MVTEVLKDLYHTFVGRPADEIVELPSSGSNRRYFRLSGPADEVCAWEFVAEDGSKAVLGTVLLLIEGYGVARYVTPRGLTPGAFYRELTTGNVFAADALMDEGFPLPINAEPYMGRTYRFERL